MALQQKYTELISTAKSSGITNLQVREQDNILYVDGEAPSNDVKQKLWDIYSKIDPDYRSGDLVMNIQIAAGAQQEYEVVKGDNLSNIAKKYNTSWKEIFDATRDKIKAPDVIQPGWKLKIPHF